MPSRQSPTAMWRPPDIALDDPPLPAERRYCRVTYFNSYQQFAVIDFPHPSEQVGGLAARWKVSLCFSGDGLEFDSPIWLGLRDRSPYTLLHCACGYIGGQLNAFRWVASSNNRFWGLPN